MEAIRDLLQEGTPQPAEVRVLRVVDLCDTPWVYPSPYGLAVNFDLFLRSDDREGKKRLCRYIL